MTAKNIFRALRRLDQRFAPLFTIALDNSPVAGCYSPPLKIFLDPPLMHGYLQRLSGQVAGGGTVINESQHQTTHYCIEYVPCISV